MRKDECPECGYRPTRVNDEGMRTCPNCHWEGEILPKDVMEMRDE